MQINGVDESLFSAQLVAGYRIGSAKITTEYWQGRSGSTFTLLSQSIGLKEISFEVVFSGKDENAVTLAKSRFDSALLGVFDLDFPNGFIYHAFLDDAGELSFDGSEQGRAKYKAIGLQRRPLVVSKSFPMSCGSTVPRTDCTIAARATATSGTITANGSEVAFTNVTVDDIIMIDAMDKRMLINGEDAATHFTWIRFPWLIPGKNEGAVTGAVLLSIAFYPTFI